MLPAHPPDVGGQAPRTQSPLGESAEGLGAGLQDDAAVFLRKLLYSQCHLEAVCLGPATCLRGLHFLHLTLDCVTPLGMGMGCCELGWRLAGCPAAGTKLRPLLRSPAGPLGFSTRREVPRAQDMVVRLGQELSCGPRLWVLSPETRGACTLTPHTHSVPHMLTQHRAVWACGSGIWCLRRGWDHLAPRRVLWRSLKGGAGPRPQEGRGWPEVAHSWAQPPPSPFLSGGKCLPPDPGQGCPCG